MAATRPKKVKSKWQECWQCILAFIIMKGLPIRLITMARWTMPVSLELGASPLEKNQLIMYIA